MNSKNILDIVFAIVFGLWFIWWLISILTMSDWRSLVRFLYWSIVMGFGAMVLFFFYSSLSMMVGNRKVIKKVVVKKK